MRSNFKGLRSLVIFLLLSILVFPYSGNSVKVLSSDNSSVVFEYTLDYSKEIVTTDQNRSFVKIGIPNGVFKVTTPGFPQLPVINVPVGVPNEFGTTIQVLSKQEEIINGQILPFPSREKSGDNYIDKYLPKDDYFNNEFSDIASFGDFGIARELRVQGILIHPVQFDAKSNQIKLVKKVIVKVNLPAVSGNYSLLNDNIYKAMVINYQTAKNWGIQLSQSLKKINDSVLSSGKWYRFEVTSEGIYKITKDQLSNYGIDSSVDPSTIKIYNNGGYELSSKLSDARPDGLVENAITVAENNGAVEEIIFYARGNNFFEFDPSENKIVRKKHFFDTKNYYWITSGGSAGKRIEKIASTENVDETQKTTEAFLFNDEDELNLLVSGRIYFNEDAFDANTPSRNFINSLSDRVSGSRISYNYQLGHYNKTSQAISVKLYEGTNLLNSHVMYGSSLPDYDFGSALTSTAYFSGAISENRSDFKIEFAATQSGTGYLDYFEIGYTRNSKAIEDSLIIYGTTENKKVEYEADGFTGSTNSIRVFKIDDFKNVSEVTDFYKSGSLIKFGLTNNGDAPNKFYITTLEKYKIPANPVLVENSNVRGFSEGVEHIIITTKEFQTQAERLATYRNQSNSPISSKVFYLDEIYNEFSCGITDPTAIRDFVSFAYNNWNLKPKYLLLFGDGSADFLGKLPNGLNTNIIPVYPTMESFYKVRSYPHEDYYVRVLGDDSQIDLAGGRLCINNETDAKSVIDKIIEYETDSDKGIWRNKISIVADDQYTFSSENETYHMTQCEDLTKYYIPDSFDLEKVYASTFPLSLSSAGERRRPELVEKIINTINNDLLLINYTGHGSPRLWAHEEIFTQDYSFKQLANENYFFMTVASCDYIEFDYFDHYSAGEEIVSMANRGAIGLMAASRPVEAGGNAALNNQFYSNLLNVSTGYSVGEALMIAKNIVSSTNSAKFLINGDPALKLHLPKFEASIDSINNQSLTNDVQVKALSRIKINGSVKNSNGTVDNSFSGKAIISVFDSERTNNLKIKNSSISFQQQGGIIFKGSVTVTNGLFSTEFVVPKDISYENKNGKITAYLFNDGIDGSGYTKNIIVGGTGSLTNDNKGPEIDIYFDDLNYKNGNMVNSNFKLILDIADETGLNTTGSGVGHKLEGIVNDDFNNTIDFTNLFVGDQDAGGKSGKVEYRFTDFETGEHKIKIKAWDVFNNPTETEEYFTVLNEEGIVLRDIYNFPNPFAENTTFTFNHNVVEPINVKINIYTVAGRKIKEIEEFEVTDKFVKIFWDGRDQDGSEIANGTYFYKLIVKSVSGEFSKSAVGKLAIIK